MLFPKQQKILELCVQEKKVLASKDPVSTGEDCNVCYWNFLKIVDSMLIKWPVRDAYLFSPKFDWSPPQDYGLP